MSERQISTLSVDICLSFLQRKMHSTEQPASCTDWLVDFCVINMSQTCQIWHICLQTFQLLSVKILIVLTRCLTHGCFYHVPYSWMNDPISAKMTTWLHDYLTHGWHCPLPDSWMTPFLTWLMDDPISATMTTLLKDYRAQRWHCLLPDSWITPSHTWLMDDPISATMTT